MKRFLTICLICATVVSCDDYLEYPEPISNVGRTVFYVDSASVVVGQENVIIRNSSLSVFDLTYRYDIGETVLPDSAEAPNLPLILLASAGRYQRTGSNSWVFSPDASTIPALRDFSADTFEGFLVKGVLEFYWNGTTFRFPKPCR